MIAVIAEALRVEPDFFLEYRLRQVADVLDGSPALADKLYGILLRHQPVPEDIAEALKARGATAATATARGRPPPSASDPSSLPLTGSTPAGPRAGRRAYGGLSPRPHAADAAPPAASG